MPDHEALSSVTADEVGIVGRIVEATDRAFTPVTPTSEAQVAL
jgi:hypothetical protein